MMEKKTLWKALGIFFGVMALFTLLSRAVYQQGTAVVQTASPMGGTINHTVRLQGKTTQKQALAVTTLPGLRIGAVLVSEGEQVKAGDVLFCLDMDYLEEKITQQSQEVRKQQLSVQDAWSQSNAQARQRANAKNQAEENYNAAVFSAEQKRNQARTALEQAQKQLNDFYAGVSGDSEKKQALEAAVREAEAGRTAAQGALDALMQERQTAIDQAIAQADTGEAPLTQEEKAAIEARIEANFAPTLAEAQTALTQAQAAEETATKDITFEELNDENVFIKQLRRGTCTLASSAMIMRRAAMLAGFENWEDITESSVGSVAWREGVGISWTFTYDGVTMTHDYVSSVEDLKKLLEEHPEGIVAYDSNKPHAIALTDYDAETDTFYCSDPAECCAKARVPVSEAIISLENVDVVWYVTSPSNLSAPVMAAAEANEAEENTEAQSVIPEIETAPVTSLDNLSHTELKLEMN